MVFRGEMTTTTRTRRPEQRPKTLHNFTLPPSLKWGSQRHLTCTKIVESTTTSGDHRLRRRSPSDRRRNGNNSRNPSTFKSADGGGEEEEEEGEGIEEFRVKIMSDLKTVRDKITRSMYALGERDDEEEERRRTTTGGVSGRREEKEVSPVKPWNLRKRRAAACKEPTEEEERRVVKERAETAKEKETVVMRPKFSVNLSKKEIEEDFMAVVGRRPPRRPKKRPRTVQKQLDVILQIFDES